MTQSLYILGGAGVGKSTFTDELIGAYTFGPLEDLCSRPNARGNLVTLRGHAFSRSAGMYLGVRRASFPGTDGLDRASSFVGEAWLREENGHEAFQMIVAEGATLSTRRFMTALHDTTDLLLLHLYTDPVVTDLRCLQRGSQQDPSYLKITETRSRNLAQIIRDERGTVEDVDTSDPEAWRDALALADEHLRGNR